jgi:ERO1-like protein alpha
VDLESECPFWVSKHMCAFKPGSGHGTPPACSVCRCESSEIPDPWKIVHNKKEFPFGKAWKPWVDSPKHQWYPIQEESSNTESPCNLLEMTYVNLQLNPEGNTGYIGKEANRVWTAIYQENCFKGNLEDMCLEQRMFYRLLSGLHTSISMHIAYRFNAQEDVFNVNDGKTLWSPNYSEFTKRFLDFPERTQNLYFVFTFYVRAIQKMKEFLMGYDFNTGNATYDKETHHLINDLVTSKSICQPTFDESIIIRNTDNQYLLDQMRSHMYNVSTIMNCVACEKCRLWAKLQTMGLSTALKVVVSENSEEILQGIQRNELIAFINGFRQLSTSLKNLKKFDVMEQRKFWAPILSWSFTGIAITGLLLSLL